MVRKKKSGKAGVSGMTGDRSELSNVSPHTGTVEHPLDDNVPREPSRDVPVPSPHPTTVDEVVPDVTASRDDGGANSSGSSPSGTRRVIAPSLPHSVA